MGKKRDYFYIALPEGEGLEAFIIKVETLLLEFHFQLNESKVYQIFNSDAKMFSSEKSIYIYLEDSLIGMENGMLNFLIVFDKEMENYDIDYCFVPFIDSTLKRVKNRKNISNYISIKPSGKHYSVWSKEAYESIMEIISELENVEIFEYGTFATIMGNKTEELKAEKTEILVASDNFQQLENYLKILKKSEDLEFYLPKFEIYKEVKL